MSETALFREQHKRILEIADRLSASLVPDGLVNEAMEARLVVSELAGMLGIHLAMEDDSLYPRLHVHPDELVRELSTRYAAEIGGLNEELRVYVKKWTYSHLIQEDPQRFIDETQTILGLLRERIEREDRELYPLIDQVYAPEESAP